MNNVTYIHTDDDLRLGTFPVLCTKDTSRPQVILTTSKDCLTGCTQNLSYTDVQIESMEILNVITYTNEEPKPMRINVEIIDVKECNFIPITSPEQDYSRCYIELLSGEHEINPKQSYTIRHDNLISNEFNYLCTTMGENLRDYVSEMLNME